MRNPFLLFQTPLDFAHRLWEKMVGPGDLVVDTTCGNGHDTLFLAGLGARVIAIDIQKKAIESTKERLAGRFADRVSFICGSHADLPESISDVKLAVYNLGYLPGGEKKLVTQTETTIKSVGEMINRLLPGGAVSITCYPGHEEGACEEEALLRFTSALDPRCWSVSHTRWTNRRLSPSLLLIQKALDNSQ